MFCTNCGEKVDETKRFCPYCGKKLREAPAPPVPRSAPNPTPAPPAPVPAGPAPDPAPSAPNAKPPYILMALDAAIAYCALFMPIAATSFLSYSASLLDIAQGSGNLASLSSLAGSSSVTKTLNNVSGFAWIVVLAVVVSVAVDLYHDLKGGGVACSGFVALGVAVLGFFFVACASKEISSSLSGFGVGSVSSSVITCGLGVWASGLLGIVSIFMHSSRPR